MKTALVLVAVGALGVAAQSGSSQSVARIPQRFVCERSYTNFAWGYQHSGIYVDREGVVYQFNVRVAGYPKLPHGPDRTESEMENKYGPDTKVLRTVSASELRAMYELIPAAAKGPLSKRVSAGADRGASVSACYLFDPGSNRYREVELEVVGDWTYRNLAPEARKLAAWLASLARPPQDKP
jgi:hypothetical protein